jgi:TolA-binding protein
MKNTSARFVLMTTALLLTVFGVLAVLASAQMGPGHLLEPQINVEATAHALQFQRRQTELAIATSQRVLTLKAQLEQKQQALAELEQAIQNQRSQLETDLATLQVQTEHSKANMALAQATITELKQNLQGDKSDKLLWSRYKLPLRQLFNQRPRKPALGQERRGALAKSPARGVVKKRSMTKIMNGMMMMMID